MRLLSVILLLAAFLPLPQAKAGGVGLSVTRMVYLSSAKQASLSVRNTTKEDPFLIQSWIENEQGDRSNDFVITPPLFVLKPSSENALKVIFSGESASQDRETLYWLTAKAIPQMSDDTQKNVLHFASASRIKLFYRPANLADQADKAWEMISGNLHRNRISLKNPTPYYITLVELKVDGKTMKPLMLAPKSEAELEGSFTQAQQFSYRTINDYGAWTAEVTRQLTIR
ncbi:putative fimbrial chaperone protein ElfD [Mixta theicola]|nr:fimbria/pilus periplasmic chaperone [Mixta theicola]QHM76276.1 putative fimbrial chaperone protein ElfD [Mixta theicola]